MSLTAINSRFRRFVPGVTRNDGWWICALGLGAIVLAIHFYPMGFGRVFHIAEGILIATTGLRLATKGTIELWVAYSWLSFFAIHFVFDAWRFDPSNLLGGSWNLALDATCAVGCAAFITHRARTSVISNGQD